MTVKNIERTKIWSLPNRDLIIRWIKEGISAREISRRMAKQGIKLTDQSIRVFKKALIACPDDEFLKRFTEVDKLIDAVEEHAKLCQMQKSIIAKDYESLKDGERISRDALRRNMELYSVLLQTQIKIKQMLGAIPYPTKVTLSQSQEAIKELDSIRNKILKERKVLVKKKG